jgi:hypothetical protein
MQNEKFPVRQFNCNEVKKNNDDARPLIGDSGKLRSLVVFTT